MAARAKNRNNLSKTSPTEPLIQIQEEFTEMYRIKSTRIAQMIPLPKEVSRLIIELTIPNWLSFASLYIVIRLRDYLMVFGYCSSQNA